MHSPMKSMNMMSTIGRRPVAAAPTPSPMIAGLGDRRVDRRAPRRTRRAARGSSRTRCPRRPTSSPARKTSGTPGAPAVHAFVDGARRRGSCAVQRERSVWRRPWRDSSEFRTVVDVVEQRGDVGEGARLGEGDAVERVLAHSRVDGGGLVGREHAELGEARLEHRDRIALLPREHLLVGAIVDAHAAHADVVVEAIGLALEQRRAARPCARARSPRRRPRRRPPRPCRRRSRRACRSPRRDRRRRRSPGGSPGR